MDGVVGARCPRGAGGEGVFRVPPLEGELTSSFLHRIAARYGIQVQALRSGWQWRSAAPPRHESGSARADPDVLLNAAGWRVLARLCGVEEDVLARALPSFGQEDAKLAAAQAGVPAGLWRIGSAVAGPVAFGCRPCTARRTGTAVRVVPYAARRRPRMRCMWGAASSLGMSRGARAARWPRCGSPPVPDAGT
ncbi:hypothetical protein ACLQ18_35980 [Streptomyces sp. DT193]|uniref:hypothetical protein n=1 Tax=Streptomyces sp. DT193 TaxID=3393418 RepID=UPI003CF12EAE